jgi:ACR3 family arsenite efflux pump ArsB
MSGPVAEESTVLARLSPLDRLLPLWILLAMAGGLLLGRLVPGWGQCRWVTPRCPLPWGCC